MVEVVEVSRKERGQSTARDAKLSERSRWRPAASTADRRHRRPSRRSASRSVKEDTIEFSLGKPVKEIGEGYQRNGDVLFVVDGGEGAREAEAGGLAEGRLLDADQVQVLQRVRVARTRLQVRELGETVLAVVGGVVLVESSPPHVEHRAVVGDQSERDPAVGVDVLKTIENEIDLRRAAVEKRVIEKPIQPVGPTSWSSMLVLVKPQVTM